MPSRLLLAGLLVTLSAGCGDDASPPADGAAGAGGSAAADAAGGAGGAASDAATSADASAGSDARDAGATDLAVSDAPAGEVSTAEAGAPGADAPMVAADAAVDSAVSMLALVADDKPGVTPCPGQAILQDQAQLEGLKTAMRDGVVTYLDVPFNGADANIYKKKCGYETFFDPATNTDPIPVMGAPKLATILATGHGGICADGFSGNFGADDGFPAMGVYRKDFKVAHMGATYHVRARVTARGTAAGQKFSAHGIVVPGDIQNTLVYRLLGMTVAHDNLWTSIAAGLTANGSVFPGAELSVSKAGTDLFQSKMELICATKM